MRTIRTTTQFKKDFKLCKKKGCPEVELILVLKMLQNEEPLPLKYKDHPLTGEWKNCRDCHLQPDWLLIYSIDVNEIVLYRTGSHSDLFQ